MAAGFQGLAGHWALAAGAARTVARSRWPLPRYPEVLLDESCGLRMRFRFDFYSFLGLADFFFVVRGANGSQQ